MGETSCIYSFTKAIFLIIVFESGDWHKAWLPQLGEGGKDNSVLVHIKQTKGENKKKKREKRKFHCYSIIPTSPLKEQSKVQYS